MKEGLFKYIIIIVVIFSCCFPNSVELKTYDFIYIDFVPLEVSKNNFGCRVSEIDNENRLFINTQNWVAENLYLSGSFSSTSNKRINIIYSLHLGYQKQLSDRMLKNFIIDFGYSNKRLELNPDYDFKWNSLSVIFNTLINENFHFFPSWTYLFTSNDNLNDDSKSFITFDYLKSINENLILKFALQFYNEENVKFSPSISLKYKI